jgi:hypothetical protein
MRTMINGQWCSIPEDEDGVIDAERLYQTGEIPSDRMLIETRPNLENVVLPRKGPFKLHPDSSIIVAPIMVRGDVPDELANP